MKQKNRNDEIVIFQVEAEVKLTSKMGHSSQMYGAFVPLCLVRPYKDIMVLLAPKDLGPLPEKKKCFLVLTWVTSKYSV